MRFPRIYEEDGCCTAAECDLCGGEIYRGRRYYRINGQTVCPDCLADYAQRANARLRNLAAGLRRQAEQRLAGELDTREIKELTAVLRELMNLQQTLEGQQPGGSPLRVVLEEETEDWSV